MPIMSLQVIQQWDLLLQLVDGFTNHVLLASTGRIPIVPVSLGRSAGAGTPLRSGIERAKQ
jgi:hypothetical protein